MTIMQISLCSIEFILSGCVGYSLEINPFLAGAFIFDSADSVNFFNGARFSM